MNSIMNKITHFFKNIRNIIRWIPTLWKDREWDYGFMLELEYNKLKNMVHWYETNNYGHCTSGDTVVKQMKLAISLLDIILEKNEWWHINFPDDYKWFDENHRYNKLSDNCYVVDAYVNINNWHRYLPWLKETRIKESPNFWKTQLRVEKAWRLYHMLRERYMRDWWD